MVKPGGQNHHHSSQFAQCPTLNKPPEMLDSDSDLAFIFTICKSYTDQITNSWKRNISKYYWRKTNNVQLKPTIIINLKMCSAT